MIEVNEYKCNKKTDCKKGDHTCDRHDSVLRG